jgi:very-short-patch-repair endonuclease
MNRWEQIKAFYAKALPEIMAGKSSQWGCDPYEWDGHGVTMTPIESWLWHDIRAEHLVLYPQFPVAWFFVDFANPKAKVVIECDGAAFHQDDAKDAARDKKLRAAGWSVYRINGVDCRDGVGMDRESQSKARQFLRMVSSFHNIRIEAV